MISCRGRCTRTVAQYRLGWASILPTTWQSKRKDQPPIYHPPLLSECGFEERLFSRKLCNQISRAWDLISPGFELYYCTFRTYLIRLIKIPAFNGVVVHTKHLAQDLALSLAEGREGLALLNQWPHPGQLYLFLHSVSNLPRNHDHLVVDGSTSISKGIMTTVWEGWTQAKSE